MNTAQEFVSRLTVVECQQMHLDYLKFEANGYLDDPSELRTQLGIYLGKTVNQTPYFSTHAISLMFEVYRRFAVYDPTNPYQKL